MAKDKPKIFILSGFKLEEPISIMEKMLDEDRTDFVLCAGMLGKTILKAQGIDFGEEDKFMKEKGFNEFLPRLKKVMEKHKDKVILPVDFAIEVEGKRQNVKLDDLPVDALTYDVGSATTDKFKEYIDQAKCMTLNGPLGLSERPLFARSTRKIFEAVAQAEGHSIIGGGQTLEAVKALSIDERKFNLVSLAGGALLEYLGGRKLPGLECLKQEAP
jgi:phosphoglycerate kinase